MWFSRSTVYKISLCNAGKENNNTPEHFCNIILGKILFPQHHNNNNNDNDEPENNNNNINT